MTAETALVVATYSRRMQLQLPDGRTVDARIKGKRIKPVCGDRVEAEPIPDEPDWLITAVCVRRNELTRPNLRGTTEVSFAISAGTPADDVVLVKPQTVPKTSSGKVDRSALPEPGRERPDLKREYAPPRNETERAIASVWAELLGVDRVGIYDDFFALGLARSRRREHNGAGHGPALAIHYAHGAVRGGGLGIRYRGVDRLSHIDLSRDVGRSLTMRATVTIVLMALSAGRFTTRDTFKVSGFATQPKPLRVVIR